MIAQPRVFNTLLISLIALMSSSTCSITWLQKPHQRYFQRMEFYVHPFSPWPVAIQYRQRYIRYFQVFKYFHKAEFRSYMQQLFLISEKISLFLEEKPHQTMTLQRQGTWAQSIWSRFQPAVGKELPICAAIYWDTAPCSIVKNSYHPRNIVTYILDIFSGNFSKYRKLMIYFIQNRLKNHINF
jgi:hypothetical protein